MTIQIVTMGESGRIVIPASLRKELDVKSGDKLVVNVKDGELRIYNQKKSIERIRKKAQKLKKSGENIVDDFLKKRKDYSGDV